MLKLMVVLHRRSDWSRAQFDAYLKDVHGPLAEKLPNLLHYTQNFVAADPSRKPPEWDAIVELFWADWATMEDAWRSPAGVAATADLEAFADLGRTTWSVVDAHLRR